MPETISSEIFTPEVIQHWHRAREYRKYKYEKHFIKKHKKKIVENAHYVVINYVMVV